MNVEHKDATITNTDDTFPGSFEVILSTPEKDRDGDTLLTEDWKQPLPDHITFDVDHGMSVATTVGSGVPTIEDGKIVVRGTYSSLPRAQEVRTLVKERHIRTTSVAFMSEESMQKDGTSRTTRELLNGAFVAIPSNRGAVVLASKGATPTPAEVFGKAGARNSASDAAHIQAIHDHAVALGAGPMDDTGAETGTTGGKTLSEDDVKRKSIVDSLEATQDRARDALDDLYGTRFCCLRGTLSDSLIFDLFDPAGGWEIKTYRQTYTDDGSVITLTGIASPVDVMEIVTPDPDDDESATEAPAEEKAADEDEVHLKYRALRNQIDAQTA